MIGQIHWRLVSPVALWGKMPCCGDFIRRNLPFVQEEALGNWVRQKHSVLSPQEDAPQRKVTNGIRWVSLEATVKHPIFGFPGLPWSFVLPPGSLPFADDRYLIGVWMDSFDKVGRQYPIVMIQSAAQRWVRQYFAFHAEQPCEWLFNASRLIAHSLYTQEDEVERHHDSGTEIDRVAFLQARLNALWSLYAPDWRHFLGKRVSLPVGKERRIQELVDSPHPSDPTRYLEGVRFLPWTDWPDCLLNRPTQGYFWQQNMQGRFIGAIRT